MAQQFGTKAETLARLAEQGFPVPPLLYFDAEKWRNEPERVLRSIYESYAAKYPRLAVRSSAVSEDGAHGSQAGAFHSVLHVSSGSFRDLIAAIADVQRRLPQAEDQIFIQPMVADVAMSGVVMTRALDDGSPYYVINYDDVSGRTDTVTSGAGASKTVYIYKGAREEDFDSPRLRAVVRLAQALEECFEGGLDIEFALDRQEHIHLLQVRRICAERHWIPRIEQKISRRMKHVEEFISRSMTPRYGLFGRRTILGVMPDWNPAEMIGVSPRPLAFSLYRELITRRTWSLARERMGYRPLPPAELMVAVSGKPYIDVRASFNSFLPADLPDPLCERLVDAWLDRLDDHPNFHDKVEFEIVHTVADFDCAHTFAERYPGMLSPSEFSEYHRSLTRLTGEALQPGGTLDEALARIEILRGRQERDAGSLTNGKTPAGVFDCVLRLALLLEECLTLGTLPFAVAARHAFIAESLLRSAVRVGALRPERADAFKRSIRTVSGELTEDFRKVCAGALSQERFLRVYGHLRPGTYDILSPSYAERPELFGGSAKPQHAGDDEPFALASREEAELDRLLAASSLRVSPRRLLEYMRAAIAGREHAKFIFTRHLSRMLDTLALWGERLDLDREALSLLPVSEVLNSLSTPLPDEGPRYFRGRVEEHRLRYELERTCKLAYLIRSVRDVYIVPQHRSAPNFITSRRLEAPAVYLDAHSDAGRELRGAIVCIESADPGYDWIFTRDIAGLVTRYGGTNSHMAIRCAEYGLPAAIGCGDLLFERVRKAAFCLLDCGGKTLAGLAAPGDAGSGSGL